MKLATVLLLFLAISQISISIQERVSLQTHRYQRRRVRRHRTRGPANNKWYHLFMGVLGELAGGDHSAIQQCLPDDWKTETSPAAEGEGEASSVTSSGGVFEKIMNIVGPIIDMFCKVKGWIKGMLGMRLYRRYGLRRSFVMRKMRKWAWLSNVWNKVKSGVSTAFNTVKNGVVKAATAVKDAAVWVGTKVKEGVEWVIAKAKEAVMAVIGKIKEWWNKLVEKVKSIFNSPIVQKILNIFDCLKNLVGPAKELVSVVKGIVSKVRNIIAGGLLGLIDVLLDLICNWREFKAAVDFLIAGIKESDTNKKFGLIGKFIGKLLYAIGKSRRLRRYYYRLRLYRLRRH